MGRFSVFGGNGFVGGAIASRLEREGCEVARIGRSNWPAPGTNLGDVIFTVGMTADFRKKLVETVETQVVRLHEALAQYSFSSFVYLSSARIYAGAPATHEETPIPVRSWDEDHVYNISKLAGESLCFAYRNPKIRVVRMSNVFGAEDRSNLFLTAVMRDAVTHGAVTIGQAPESSKDYIWVGDAAEAIVRIARGGRYQIYNVAAGQNLTHKAIADILKGAGYGVTFKDDGAIAHFPPIDTTRFKSEFDLAPRDARASIASVLEDLKKNRIAQ
jgi:nucleoside-diphosphate-sugar epimerase